MPGPGASGPRVEFLANSLVIGGAERVVEALCRGLPQHGWRVGLGLLREPGPIGESLANEGVEMTSRLAPRRRDPFQVLSLARHLGRVHADAVYVLDHSNALLYGRLAAALRRKPQLCAIHRTRRADGRPSLSSMDRRLMGLSHRVIAVSETQRDYLEHEEGVAASRLVAIPNGIDVDRFDPRRRPEPREELRRRLDLPRDRTLLGVIAALRPEKNHELLLRAVAGAEDLQDCDLVFAGTGPRQQQLAASVRASGMTSRVHWMGEVEDVAPVLWSLDALVLPSHPRVETFPLCVLEAMAARVPVLCTDVGSLREMLGPEGAGGLVPPGDVEALRDVIRATLADADATSQRVDRAYARVRERYSSARMVESTAALLAEIHGP
jgi:glycosyltransferase involved in cell wall biosynthesis